MGNPRITWMILLLAIVAGCAADQHARQLIDAGNQAFNEKKYDQAIASADRALAENPNSPDAYYLRGRSYEQRAMDDTTAPAATADLAKAQSNYQAALDANPSKPTEALARCGLANLAFHRDDYTAALSDYSQAIDNLPKDETRCWALYRMGQSQQRLGRFADADRTFAAVIDGYPNTEPARRSKEHQGATAFYVQVGAFTQAKDADAAAAAVRSAGMEAIRVSDKGMQIVRAGPVPTYHDAEVLKQKLIAQFPQAVIEP